MKYNTNGTVTISITDFDEMRDLFEEKRKSFNEEKEKFEKGLVRSESHYGHRTGYSYVSFLSKDDVIEKITERHRDEIDSLYKRTERNFYNEFRYMSLIEFYKWKRKQSRKH